MHRFRIDRWKGGSEHKVRVFDQRVWVWDILGKYAPNTASFMQIYTEPNSGVIGLSGTDSEFPIKQRFTEAPRNTDSMAF